MYNEVMSISREQQLSLVREVKLLIDENKGNKQVLERANSLALVVFGILSNEGDSHSLGFSLQEYAYECLEANKGNSDTVAWIDENNKKLNDAIGLNDHDRHDHYGSGNGPNNNGTHRGQYTGEGH
jgi:hypothetical protein